MFKKFKAYFYNLVKKTKTIEEKSTFDIINDLYDSLDEDTVCICLGSDFKNYADDIKCTVQKTRNDIKEKTGFIFPAVRFKIDENLQENEADVLVNGNIVFREFIIPNKENLMKNVESILNMLYENHLKDIFSNESLEKYIEHVRIKNYKLAADVSYNLATIEIKYILIVLLENKKTIKNISFIFEKISEQLFIENTHTKSNPISISREIIKYI